MTTNAEVCIALRQLREFLTEVCDGEDVADRVRKRARKLLRNLPHSNDITSPREVLMQADNEDELFEPVRA
jgi:hypothetical protein